MGATHSVLKKIKIPMKKISLDYVYLVLQVLKCFIVAEQVGPRGKKKSLGTLTVHWCT